MTTGEAIFACPTELTALYSCGSWLEHKAVGAAGAAGVATPRGTTMVVFFRSSPFMPFVLVASYSFSLAMSCNGEKREYLADDFRDISIVDNDFRVRNLIAEIAISRARLLRWNLVFSTVEWPAAEDTAYGKCDLKDDGSTIISFSPPAEVGSEKLSAEAGGVNLAFSIDSSFKMEWGKSPLGASRPCSTQSAISEIESIPEGQSMIFESKVRYTMRSVLSYLTPESVDETAYELDDTSQCVWNFFSPGELSEVANARLNCLGNGRTKASHNAQDPAGFAFDFDFKVTKKFEYETLKSEQMSNKSVSVGKIQSGEIEAISTDGKAELDIKFSDLHFKIDESCVPFSGSLSGQIRSTDKSVPSRTFLAHASTEGWKISFDGNEALPYEEMELVSYGRCFSL